MAEGRIQTIKYAPPPPELPVYGKGDPKNIVFFGRTNYVAALEEKKYVFGVKREDRRRHLYLIGKSGVGKSKLLELILRQDIAQGYGLCLIEPSGDLTRSVLDFVPEERAQDVIVIDAADPAHPAAWNPLANIGEYAAHDFMQGMIEVMSRQFGGSWNARMEHVFRFACLALLGRPGAALQDMIPLLTDAVYRERVVADLRDDLEKRFWEVEFPALEARADEEAIAPLVNKLAQLFSNPVLRAMLSGKENKIDLDACIRGKKIVLLNLARGRMGDEAANFLGSLFILRLKQAVHAQNSEDGDFYLYVDEFELIATNVLQHILSHGRKSGISLVLAHQYGSQIPTQFLAAISGNVGTLIVFRVGGEDAQRLKSEMAPVFDAKDMMNLGTGEFYIKMMIDGEPYDPFSAETLKVLPPPHTSLRERILEMSRKRFGVQSSE